MKLKLLAEFLFTNGTFKMSLQKRVFSEVKTEYEVDFSFSMYPHLIPIYMYLQMIS